MLNICIIYREMVFPLYVLLIKNETQENVNNFCWTYAIHEIFIAFESPSIWLDYIVTSSVYLISSQFYTTFESKFFDSKKDLDFFMQISFETLSAIVRTHPNNFGFSLISFSRYRCIFSSKLSCLKVVGPFRSFNFLSASHF